MATVTASDLENVPVVRPFLRWAGSKRKQIGRLRSFWSNSHTGYVEPFAGSACLFFAISPSRSVLGDSNPELIEVFKVVRDAPEELYDRLIQIDRDVGTYNRWRAIDPDTLDLNTRALRMLYLNRNCFNGIFRTNCSGKFNVPMGSKLSRYLAKSDLIMCSKLLQNTQLLFGDFLDTLQHVKGGDFVYLDPPYAVTSRRIFREYGKNVFDTSDIPRLSLALEDIRRKGADFLVSYADCREARQLAKQWNSVRLPVRRNIAGFARDRRNSYEWLITNMPINPPSRHDNGQSHSR